MEERSGFGYFLLGLGIGVAAGVLWAPRTGEETRQLLADKAGEGADYLKTRAQEGSEYVKTRAQEGSEYVKNQAQAGSEYVRQQTDTIKQSAADLYEKGRTTISQQKDTLNAAVEAGKQAYRDALSDVKTSTSTTPGTPTGNA